LFKLVVMSKQLSKGNTSICLNFKIVTLFQIVTIPKRRNRPYLFIIWIN